MARPLPDALERRSLLWDAKRPVDHVGWAERYLEAGRKSDALDFVDRVADPAQREALRAKVREEALASGNSFLLNRLEAAAPLGEEGWRSALKQARGSGKLRYALKIARKLGDAAEVEALERELGIFRPAPTPEAATPATPASPAATDGVRPGERSEAEHTEGDGPAPPAGDSPDQAPPTA